MGKIEVSLSLLPRLVPASLRDPGLWHQTEHAQQKRPFCFSFFLPLSPERWAGHRSATSWKTLRSFSAGCGALLLQQALSLSITHTGYRSLSPSITLSLSVSLYLALPLPVSFTLLPLPSPPLSLSPSPFSLFMSLSLLSPWLFHTSLCFSFCLFPSSLSLLALLLSLSLSLILFSFYCNTGHFTLILAWLPLIILVGRDDRAVHFYTR